MVERGNGEDGNGHPTESGNIDRVRDVLFGAQMRDYDTRLQRLDERLTKIVTEARANLQKRIEGLERAVESEMELLTNRLKAEGWERRMGIEKLVRRVAEAAKAFELKIENLDQESAREIKDLRRQLDEQSNALRAEIKKEHEQRQIDLDRETEQIRGAITSYAAQAEMLSEVALRKRLLDRFQVKAA
jgi:hypothetical protein